MGQRTNLDHARAVLRALPLFCLLRALRDQNQT
jgi:hypothetical protein